MILLSCVAEYFPFHPSQGDIRVVNRPLESSRSEGLVKETPSEASEGPTLIVRCRQGARDLPFFAVVSQADGRFVDGSGRGLYSDGRFASEGSFQVRVAPGPVKISVRSGPNYVPFETTIEARTGTRTELTIALHKWFSPESRGWYSGDNHVHPAHDQKGEIRTDLANAQLQARANGLSFVTQASSEFPFPDHLALSTPEFLLRRSLENRQGSFAGHLNSPGVEIPPDDRKKTMHDPMPDVAAIDYARSHGAAIIHTHTVVPPHQLHWMGATGAYSYGVLGRVPDAVDIDGEASEQLWFTLLNLGNRVACSGSTDAALERPGSPAPGARRMYVRSPKFEYEAMVKGMRDGRLFATNGGPLSAFFTVDGKGLGETLAPGKHELSFELRSLHPLAEAQLIRSGRVLRSLPVRGLSGETRMNCTVSDEREGWYVVKARDEKGNWAITSPVYVRPAHPKPRPFRGSLIFEIGNFTRLSELRKQFMAHFIATVSTDDPLAKVELMREETAIKSFTVKDGDQIRQGKTPVTETFGEFEPGWQWVYQGRSPVRFQADWNVDTSGWYRVRAITRSGRILESDSINFDANRPVSHELSAANVLSQDVFLRHWGYGESGSFSEIGRGDQWWYPQHTFWRYETRFGDSAWTQGGGDPKRETVSFLQTAAMREPKATPQRPAIRRPTISR